MKVIGKLGQVKVVSRDGLVAQAKVEKAVTERIPLRLMGKIGEKSYGKLMWGHNL